MKKWYLSGRNVILTCVAVTLLCLTTPAGNGMAAWEERAASATGGGVSNTAGGSEWSSLALYASGNPHIAWVDESGGDW